MTANKLTLNIKKTKFILIGSLYRLSQVHNDFTVQVNSKSLERVSEHKILGVHTDESLTWRPRINDVIKKISAGLAALRHLSATIPFDTRINIYNALVTPYFNYCSPVWGNIGKSLSDKLQKLQHSAARVVTLSDYEIRSSDLLDGLGWERLENFRLKQLALLMYKIHNNLSPLYPKQIFYNISTVHTHKLRNSESNYYIPRPRTEYAKGSLHYKGSVLWNRIPLVFYSHTFIFMLSSNKVWEKRLISGLSQAGTAWLRKSSRYDSRDFLGGTGWAVQLFAAPLKN